jgi:phosphoribosylglycinamide formyltransferase-1
MVAAALIVGAMQSRLVVLVSGTGTNLQALIDACADESFGARVVAVGADRDGIGALDRARAAGIPTFVRRVKDFTDRAAWDRALAAWSCWPDS